MKRDRITWAAYAYCGAWGWILYAWGPAMAQLRDETGVSRTVSSLHGVAVSAGALVAGTVGVILVRRYGRRAAMVVGLLAIAAGIGALMLSSMLPLTLAAGLVIGVGGSLGLNAMSPLLAAHHPDWTSSAISEANAVAAALGLVAPLTIGAAVWAGWGWRPAVAVGAFAAVAAALLIWRAPAGGAWGGETARTGEPAKGRLGLAFWACLGMLFCTVAVEFATSFWAVDLLRSHKGLGVGAASAAFAAFVAGMAVSRIVTPRLARRWRDRRLQAGSLVIALAGWALMWLPQHPAPAVAGLAVLGLGAGLHFPIGITLLMQAVPSRPDTATAYASVVAGVAAGSAPFALGAVADRIGPHRAFLIVPAVLVVAGGMLLVNRRAALQEYLSARRELLIPAPKRAQT